MKYGYREYYKGKSRTFYSYEITLDGRTSKKDFDYMIDYKQTRANLLARGYKQITFKYLGNYTY